MCFVLFGCTSDRTREAMPAADSVSQRPATVPVRTDTLLVLGTVERDLTGDGRPEILRLTGVGKSTDSLDVTFVIESSGDTLFQAPLAPLTKVVGFDAGRRVLSASEHRAQLEQFGRRFFDPAKFTRPGEFLEQLRRETPGRIADIPNVIARDRGRNHLSDSRIDTAGAVDLWREIQTSPVTVFSYSPGGDAVTAIAWSASDRRFYRLWECC